VFPSLSLRSTTGGGSAGAELEDAARLVARAEDALESLVVFEAISGTTWEDIGSGLGVARQNAHKKFSGAVARFKEALAEPEVRGAGGQLYNRLPDSAADPDRWAPKLDDWIERHREPWRFPGQPPHLGTP
jgi:hypothetical protein